MRTLLLLLIPTIILACQSNEPPKAKPNLPIDTQPISQISQDELSFETYDNERTGWGYKIHKNGKLMIDQPHIPSIQGNKGFSSQFKAAVAAQFIIEKLNKNIFPPSFSPSELDSLGLLD